MFQACNCNEYSDDSSSDEGFTDEKDVIEEITEVEDSQSLKITETKQNERSDSVGDSDSTPQNKSKIIPAGIYLLKVNNRNTRTRCERHQTPLASFWCLYR